MSNKPCFIDIHALQVIPPSCMNRDDTGAPKSCQYGGVPRARVSSQCWKRSARKDFPEDYVGIRTKKVPILLRDRIMALDPSKSEAEALALSNKVLQSAGVIKKKEDKDDGDAAGGTPVKEEKAVDALGAAFFLSDAQVSALAEQALKNPSDKKAAVKAMMDNSTADIAMFGRMAAANPTLNVDACVQVAHAISTHAVHTEYDYFTAVDEMNAKDETGAGHVDTAEFNSSVLYRYACVNVTGLYDMLGEEAVKAACTFARCFLTSMPTGKINSFANFTKPGYVRICVRDDEPMSFVGAFHKPVRTRDGGFFDESVTALEAYATDMKAKYDAVPVSDLSFADGSLNTIMSKLEDVVTGMFAGGGDEA